MMASLDILVVDDRPETIRFLTEFLVQRCRRVDVASSVREAMTAVTRRRAAGERYHLVISDFVMPEADGLALLRELRSRQDDVAFVFATGYRSLNPGFEPEAKRLGALAILDKPIDLRRVEEIVNQTTATFRRKREEQQGDQPFFGTSKMYRRPVATSQEPSAAPPAPPAAPVAPVAQPAPASVVSDALERRQRIATPAGGTGSFDAQSLSPAPGSEALERVRPPPVAPAPAVPPAGPPPPPPQAPVTGYQRRPSGLVQQLSTTTSRIRRSVEPAPPPPGGTGTARLARNATPQPPTAFTARIRRGVEGTASISRPAARTESGRMVSCTMCGRSFLILAKPEAYTTVCLHCGQLQRIDPS